MMKTILMGAAIALAAVASPMSAMAADTPVYNSAPADGFHYGDGNDYAPANAAVVTSGATELALRFHVPGEVASASDASGLYMFALGSNVSFDFSIDGVTDGNAMLTLTNLLTGDTAFFNPFLVGGNDVENGSTQNSEQLSFGFLNNTGAFAGCCGDLNFDPNVDDTYRADLTAGSTTLSAFAQVGAGAVPAVPEPATWAMMLIGFGGIGFSMRRKRGQATLAQLA